MLYKPVLHLLWYGLERRSSSPIVSVAFEVEFLEVVSEVINFVFLKYWSRLDSGMRLH